ncbi:MAG: hypothetical protein JWM93_519 [Frankiales bacterium]|nr:hypothetical protein [Frankiales bacterium]
MAESLRKKRRAAAVASAIVATVAVSFAATGALARTVGRPAVASPGPTAATATISPTQAATSTSATPTGAATSAPSQSSDAVSNADLSAASAAMLDALIDRQRVTVSENARLGVRPSADEVQQLQRTRVAALSQRYLGVELERMRKVVDRVPAILSAPDFQALDGGADSLNVTASRRTDSDSVELTGTARTWAKMAQLHADGTSATASPSNVIQFVAVLTQRGKSWLLEDLDWKFAPGSEP